MSNPQGDEWLADPTGRHQLRYFAGGRWTDNVADGGVTSTDPYDAPAAAPDPAPVPSTQDAPRTTLGSSVSSGTTVLNPHGLPPTPPPPYQQPQQPQQPPPSQAPAPMAPPGYPQGGYAQGPAPGPPTAMPRPIIGFALSELGFVAVIVGAVLPWVTISGVITDSKLGIEGDGVITVFFAVVGAIAALVMLLTRARGLGIGVIVCAGLIGAIGLWDMLDVSSKVGDVNLGGDLLQAGVGIGIFVTLAAAGIMFLGGVLGLARK